METSLKETNKTNNQVYTYVLSTINPSWSLGRALYLESAGEGEEIGLLMGVTAVTGMVSWNNVIISLSHCNYVNFKFQ